MTREQQLYSAASLYVELVRPFTARPIGAPGSAERQGQDARVAAYEGLCRALQAYKPEGVVS